MTLTRPLIQYHYVNEHENNIKTLTAFAKFFNPNCEIEFDNEHNTLIITGDDNLFPQKLFNGEYLIYDATDDNEKTFSVGVVDDMWGYSEQNNK